MEGGGGSYATHMESGSMESQPHFKDLEKVNKHITPFSFDGLVLSKGVIHCKSGSTALVLFLHESDKVWKMILWNYDALRDPVVDLLCVYRFYNCKIGYSRDVERQTIVTTDMAQSMIQYRNKVGEIPTLDVMEHCTPSTFSTGKALVGVITEIQSRRKMLGGSTMRLVEICGEDGISVDLQCYDMESVIKGVSVSDKVLLFGVSRMKDSLTLSMNRSGSMVTLERNIPVDRYHKRRNASYPTVATTIGNDQVTIRDIHTIYDISRIFQLHQESLFIRVRDVVFLELYGPYKGYCVVCRKHIHYAEREDHAKCLGSEAVEKKNAYLYLNVTDASQGYISLRIGEKMVRKMGYESIECIDQELSLNSQKVVSRIARKGKDITILCTRWKSSEKKDATLFYHLVAIQ